MKARARKFLLTGLSFLLLILIGGFFFTQWLLDSQWLRRQVRLQIEDRLGVPVEIGHLGIDLRGRILVKEFEIGTTGEYANDFFDVKQLALTFRWMELTQGKIDRVVLVEPVFTLQQNDQGRWNLPPGLLEGNGEGEGPAIPEVDIEQGTAEIHLPDRKYRIETMALSLSEIDSVTQDRRVRLSARGKVAGWQVPFRFQGQLGQKGKRFSADLQGAVMIPEASGSFGLTAAVDIEDGTPEAGARVESRSFSSISEYGTAKGRLLSATVDYRGGAVTSAGRIVLESLSALGGQAQADSIFMNYLVDYENASAGVVLDGSAENISAKGLKASKSFFEAKVILTSPWRRVEGGAKITGPSWIIPGERNLEEVQVDWSDGVASATQVEGQLEVKAARLPLPVSPEISLEEVFFSGSVSGNPSAPEITLSKGVFRSGRIPEMSFQGEVHLNTPRSGSVEIDTDVVNLAGLYSNWEEQLPQAYREWMLDGTGEIQLSARLEEKPEEIAAGIQGSLKAGSGSFFSGDGQYAASGLSARASFDVEASFETSEGSILDRMQKVNWKEQMLLQGQEALYGAYYQDLSGVSLDVESRGTWWPAREVIRFETAGMDLAQLGSWSVTGKVENIRREPEADLAVKSRNFQLGPFYQRFIEEGVLKEILPALKVWKGSGTVNADFDVKGTRQEGWVEGRAQVKDGLLGKKQGLLLLIDDFDIDLPFLVGTRKDPGRQDSRQAPRAEFSYGQILIGPLTLGSQRLPFILYNNDFRVPEQVDVPFYGGSLMIRELVLQDFLSPDKQLEFDIQLRDVDLQPIAVDAGLPPLSGTISASLPRFDTVEGGLVSDGPAQLEVFNGVIDVNRLRVDGIFSGQPLISFSSEFRKIDLFVLTTVLQYGRASGIIEGYLRDFRATPEGPRHFIAEVRSVPESGVDRRISADLIEVITAAGRGVNVAERAILHQNDEYGYRSLGLHVELRDGRLYVKGIAKEGQEDFFLVGSLFQGIDMRIITSGKGRAYQVVVDDLMRAARRVKSGGVVVD